MNKPKRPCGIYNLFYQLERELLIQKPNSVFDQLCQPKKSPRNNDEKGNRKFMSVSEADDADQRPPRYRHLVLASDWFKSGRRVRKHCKTKDNLPENLGFEGLNKVISEKWKTADEETKRYLKVISDQEWELYRKEMRAYKRIQEELTKIMTAKASEAKVEESKIPLMIMKRQLNKSCTSKEILTIESRPKRVASKCKQQPKSQIHFPVGVSSASVLCGESPPTPPVSSFFNPKEVLYSKHNSVCSFIPLREHGNRYSFEQPRGGDGHNVFGTTHYAPWPRRDIEYCDDQKGLCQMTPVRSRRGVENKDTHLLSQIHDKNIRAQIAITSYQQQYENQNKLVRSNNLNQTSVFLDHTVRNPNLINSMDDSLSMILASSSVFPQPQCRPITSYSDNNGFVVDQPPIQSGNRKGSGGGKQYEHDFPRFHPVSGDTSSRLTSSERLEFLSQMDNRIDGLLHDFSQSEESASLFYHASSSS